MWRVQMFFNIWLFFWLCCKESRVKKKLSWIPNFSINALNCWLENISDSFLVWCLKLWQISSRGRPPTRWNLRMGHGLLDINSIFLGSENLFFALQPNESVGSISTGPQMDLFRCTRYHKMSHDVLSVTSSSLELFLC